MPFCGDLCAGWSRFLSFFGSVPEVFRGLAASGAAQCWSLGGFGLGEALNWSVRSLNSRIGMQSVGFYLVHTLNEVGFPCLMCARRAFGADGEEWGAGHVRGQRQGIVEVVGRWGVSCPLFLQVGLY